MKPSCMHKLNFCLHQTLRRKVAAVVKLIPMRTTTSCSTTTNSRRSYSDWYRKIPAQSQFTADIEGEPYKTTVTVENTVEHYLHIDSYSPYGFMLNNGFRTVGPLALFPKTALFWNIGGAEDIHMESLSLFTVLEPKLDLLIVGVGAPEQVQYVNKTLYKDLRDLGIGLELLSTHQACATFNFLNGEKRCVAAALLPPTNIASRNMETFYLQDAREDDMNDKSDYYISADTGERIAIEDAKTEKKESELESGEMPDHYTDSPQGQRKVSTSRKPSQQQLPDGDKKT